MNLGIFIQVSAIARGAGKQRLVVVGLVSKSDRIVLWISCLEGCEIRNGLACLA